jgi:hypothetical protein
MARWLRLLIASVALGMGALVAACNEADFDTVGSIILSGAADLDKDANPEVAAAGAAGSAVDQNEVTRQLVEAAIDAKGKIDLAKVDQAIDRSPYDFDLRLERAVLLTASGQDPKKSIGEARYLAGLYPFGPMINSDGATVDRFIGDLEYAIKKFDPTSIEYSRLRKQICDQKALYMFEYEHRYGPIPDECKS